MTANAKLYLCLEVIFVASLNYFDILVGAEWKTEYHSVHFNLIPISNSMLLDETFVLDQKEAISITSCSLFCARKASSSLYYQYMENICYCNSDLDTRLSVDNQTQDASSETIYGYINSALHVFTNNSMHMYDVQPHKENCFVLYHHGYKQNAIYSVQPIGGNTHDAFCDMDNVLHIGADDCLQWLQYGYSEDGVYNISLSNGTSVSAWCDQTGGGWTVIQHRQNGTVDFYRTWSEYVNGFGNAAGEYWLGIEVIFLLAKQPSSLHIEMETFGDVTPPTAYALYDAFSLGPATDKYRISTGAFTGDCGDSLIYHNNQPFTTWDSDNDQHSGSNCAINNKGAWWYKSCYDCNLNGKYRYGFYESTYRNGIVWKTCWGPNYSVKSCLMRIKRIE